MTDTDLSQFLARMRAARRPEDVFGALAGAQADQLRAGKRVYRQLAKVAHTDHYAAALQPIAHEAFTLLSAFWTQAQTRIKDGSYGKTPKAKPAAIKTKLATYKVVAGFDAGDLATLYRAYVGTDQTQRVLLKIARQPAFNDLLQREAATLDVLTKGAAKTKSLRFYFPTVRESAMAGINGAGCRLNVLDYDDGLYTVNEVVAQYPGGVDPRHFVWMFRRLLNVLGFAHQIGVVHGAVLPTHVLPYPSSHGLRLIDWCYSAKRGAEAIPAISVGYRDWYPPEVLAKRPASPATDIYMAASVMAFALGGSQTSVPDDVPAPFERILKSCWIKAVNRRPADAWVLEDAVKAAGVQVYGKAKFVPFIMEGT